MVSGYSQECEAVVSGYSQECEAVVSGYSQECEAVVSSFLVAAWFRHSGLQLGRVLVKSRSCLDQFLGDELGYF